jgi:uncharacterized membrane protein YfcA
VAELAFLIAAGFLSGVVGYVTGIASLVSYPALLLAGLPPLTANMTNTVALIPVGIGSTTSARGSMTFDRRLGYLCLAAAVGGVLGSILLLLTPADAFEAIVPYLVAVAALAVLGQPLIRRIAGRRDAPRAFVAGVVVIGIYGGYFGAGAGIIFTALALTLTALPLGRATLLKSVLLCASNAVAALGFAIFGHVDWPSALAMGIGCLAGGWIGPPVVNRLPVALLRVVIALAGFGLAAWLGLR